MVFVDDDGAVHLLLYCGEYLPNKFQIVKHVVLVGPHTSIISGMGAPEDVEVVRVDESETCHCGARRMPSGWCTSGHAPQNERLETFRDVRTQGSAVETSS